MGDHGGNRGISWDFTSYEMRYTNMEDPADPEYNNSPNPACGSSGGWGEIIYFRNGLGKSFPECGTDTSEECTKSSPHFDSEGTALPSISRDTPNCIYDPCWIGWTGGGQLPDEPKCEGGTLENLRWVRYHDRDLENEDCPPKVGKQYESEKYGCSFHQPYAGDIVPVPGWVEPNKRMYDYWCLIANHSACLNVNLLLSEAETAPFQQLTTFFNDPAFMSSSVFSSGRSLKNWRIPPCAKNETDFTAYPTKADSDRNTFNATHDYTKTMCYL